MATTGKKEDSKEVFKWTHDEMLLLCDACLEFITKHGRGQNFIWKEIQIEVEKKLGRPCNHQSCKHKYDLMRKDWRLWKELKKSETGLGWDPTSGKIDATDEWWQKKIKENHRVKKFREKGVEPHLEDKWDQLYADSYAKGENVYVPSMEPPVVNIEDDRDNEGDIDGNKGEERGVGDYSIDELHYYESALGNEQNFFRNFVEHINNEDPVAPNLGGKSGTQPSKKSQKALLKPDGMQMKRKRRQSAGSVMLQTNIGDMVSYCKKVSDSIPNASMESSTSTVGTTMQIITRMVDNGALVKGSELWCHSINVLQDSVRREFFINMGDDVSRQQ